MEEIVTQFSTETSPIPPIETLETMCQNAEIIKDADRFIVSLSDRLQKEMPIENVRFPEPFVSKEERVKVSMIPQAEVISEEFKEIAGKPVSQGISWKKILYKIIKIFTGPESELINRKVEYNNLSDKGMSFIRKLKVLQGYVPYEEIEFSRSFKGNTPLIVAFIITFMLNEYRLSKSVVVYRGISRVTVSFEEAQKELEKNIETLGKLYAKIFKQGIPGLVISHIIHKAEEYRRMKAVVPGLLKIIGISFEAMKKENYPVIFTDEFLKETGGDPERIAENELLAKLAETTANVPGWLTDVSSERTRKFLEKLLIPGDRMNSIRFWSSSLDKSVVLKGFAGEVKEGIPEECCLLEIEIPTGANVLFIGGLGYEAEVLINPCSIFELMKFDKKKNEMRLRYIGNKYPKNTEEDWELFKRVIKEFYMNITEIFTLTKPPTSRENFIVIDDDLKSRVNRYLQCIKK